MRILQLVQTAMTCKAPYVGIPIPGQRPFVIQREKLVEGLRGLRITEAAIQPGLTRDGEAYLQVFAEAEGVRGIRKFYQQWRLADNPARRKVAGDDGKISNVIWAERQRKAREPKPGPELKRKRKLELHLLKLEKQLAKLRFIERPWHPLIPRDGRGEGLTDWQRGMYERWAAWKQAKGQRRLAMRIARTYEAGGYNGEIPKGLYAEARAAGLNVRTLSDLKSAERDALGGKYSKGMEYLAKFWKFCGLPQRPDWEIKPMTWETDSFGPEHYVEWLKTVRERKQLLSEIESVKGMLTEAEAELRGNVDIPELDELAAARQAEAEVEFHS